MEGLTEEGRLEILMGQPQQPRGGGGAGPFISQAPPPPPPVASAALAGGYQPPPPVEGEDLEFSSDPYSFGAGAFVVSRPARAPDLSRCACAWRLSSASRESMILTSSHSSRCAVYNKMTGRLTAINVPRGEDAKVRRLSFSFALALLPRPPYPALPPHKSTRLCQGVRRPTAPLRGSSPCLLPV